MTEIDWSTVDGVMATDDQGRPYVANRRGWQAYFQSQRKTIVDPQQTDMALPRKPIGYIPYPDLHLSVDLDDNDARRRFNSWIDGRGVSRRARALFCADDFTYSPHDFKFSHEHQSEFWAKNERTTL